MAKDNRAKKFIIMVMDKIYQGVHDNLSGKVLHSRSKDLLRSITVDTKVDGPVVTGSIGVSPNARRNVQRYAEVWEISGRGPVIITAQGKGHFLKFRPKGRVGNVLFRKVVNIPGAAPRPFIQPAINDAQPFIEDLLNKDPFLGYIDFEPVHVKWGKK